MTITPQEIQTQEFHVRFRGFDVEEVDGFLEKVAASFLALEEKNTKLAAQVESLNQEMAEYQSKGKAFQHAILSAQQIADDLMEKSQLEAEKLVAAARSEAEEIREAANSEVAALETEVDRLHNLRDESKNELQRILTSYLEMLEAPISVPRQNNVPPEPQAPSTLAEPELEPEMEPEPEPEPEPEQEDDFSDLYQKIDLPLPDDSIAELISEENQTLPEAMDEPHLTGADEPYAAIPDLDDEIIFSLDDPLDANEPSVNFADLVPKDEK